MRVTSNSFRIGRASQKPGHLKILTPPASQPSIFICGRARLLKGYPESFRCQMGPIDSYMRLDPCSFRARLLEGYPESLCCQTGPHLLLHPGGSLQFFMSDNVHTKRPPTDFQATA